MGTKDGVGRGVDASSAWGVPVRFAVLGCLGSLLGLHYAKLQSGPPKYGSTGATPLYSPYPRGTRGGTLEAQKWCPAAPDP